MNRDLLKDSTVQSNFLDEVMKVDSSLSLSQKVQCAANATLSTSERVQPGWFQQNEVEILKLITERNIAAINFKRLNRPGKKKPVAAHRALKKARAKLVRAVQDAKQRWFDSKVNDLKNGSKHPKKYWDAVSDLRRGISETKPSQNTLFLNPNGVECKDSSENHESVRAHFSKVFNIPSSCEFDIIKEIRQRNILHCLDDIPTDDEIKKAVFHAKHGKACGDSGIAAEFWQALESRSDTSKLLHEYINDCWMSCTCPDEWLQNRLKILYKGKGDPKDLNNWRGIMLIETAAKIVCSIFGNRIQSFLNDEGLEEQNGFTPGRC